MEIKKFTQGPSFLKPILKGHNQVIDELGQRIDRVSGTDGINVAKIGGDLSISSTYGRTHFRFGIVRQAFYRGQDAIIQMCEYSGLEWHLTRYLQRVDTQFICGYYFAGMPVRLLELPETKTLQIMSEGVSYARFLLDEDLPFLEEPSTGHVGVLPVDYPNGLEDDWLEDTNLTELYSPYGGTELERTDEDDPDGVPEGDGGPEFVIPKKIGGFWNDALLRWEAGLEQCP